MNAAVAPPPTEAEEARYSELQGLAIKAARSGDSAVLAPMIDAGLPVNLADEKGNSLLMLTTYHGHLELAKFLLERGADPDRRNDRQQTPLAGVAFKGHADVVRLLVEHGADPSADQGGGRTAAQFAALFGHPEIVDYLQSRTTSPRRSLRWLSRITSVVRRIFKA